MRPDLSWLGPMIGRFGLAYGLATVALGFAIGLLAGSVGLALLVLIIVALLVLVYVIHTIGDEAKGGSVTSTAPGPPDADGEIGEGPVIAPGALLRGGPDDATPRQKLLFYALGLLATSAAALVLWGEYGPGS